MDFSPLWQRSTPRDIDLGPCSEFQGRPAGASRPPLHCAARRPAPAGAPPSRRAAAALGWRQATGGAAARGSARTSRIPRAAVPRILRNYLISFALIGLFFLVVHLINRYVEQHMPPPAPPAQEQRR